MNPIRRFVGVSLAGLALVTASCTGTDATATEAEPTTTTAAVQPGADHAATLLEFARAWEAADQSALDTLAFPNATAEALLWHDPQGDAVTGMQVALADGCVSVESTINQCSFLYAPAEGHALIFSIAVETIGDEARVTGLSMNGDAG